MQRKCVDFNSCTVYMLVIPEINGSTVLANLISLLFSD